MTDEDRARAWWDEQVIRAATTSECVDGPWEALAKLLRERDEWKAMVDKMTGEDECPKCGYGPASTCYGCRLKKAESERDAVQRENARLAKVYEHAAYVSNALREEYTDDTVTVTLPARTWQAFKREMGGTT